MCPGTPWCWRSPPMPCCRCALVGTGVRAAVLARWGQRPREADGLGPGAGGPSQEGQARLPGPGVSGGPSQEGQARLLSQAVLKRGLKSSCTIVPLMKKDQRDNLEFFLSNVGKLHLLG